MGHWRDPGVGGQVATEVKADPSPTSSRISLRRAAVDLWNIRPLTLTLRWS